MRDILRQVGALLYQRVIFALFGGVRGEARSADKVAWAALCWGDGDWTALLMRTEEIKRLSL